MHTHTLSLSHTHAHTHIFSLSHIHKHTHTHTHTQDKKEKTETTEIRQRRWHPLLAVQPVVIQDDGLGLVCNAVHVFMDTLQQVAQKLLGILLPENSIKNKIL